MIFSFERPNGSEIYEALITGDQNPISLRFNYRQEALAFQKEFYIGLEQHNDYIMTELRYNPIRSERYDYELVFWT